MYILYSMQFCQSQPTDKRNIIESNKITQMLVYQLIVKHYSSRSTSCKWTSDHEFRDRDRESRIHKPLPQSPRDQDQLYM